MRLTGDMKLYDLFTKFAEGKVSLLYVVDNDNKPTLGISLTDILNFISNIDCGAYLYRIELN